MLMVEVVAVAFLALPKRGERAIEGKEEEGLQRQRWGVRYKPSTRERYLHYLR